MFILIYGNLFLYFIYLDGKIIFHYGFDLCHIMCFFYKEKPLLLKFIINKFSFCTFGPLLFQFAVIRISRLPTCRLLRKTEWLDLRGSHFFFLVSHKKIIRYRSLLGDLQITLFGVIVTLRSYNQGTVIEIIIFKFPPLVWVHFAVSHERNDYPSSCHSSDFPCSLLRVRRKRGFGQMQIKLKCQPLARTD